MPAERSGRHPDPAAPDRAPSQGAAVPRLLDGATIARWATAAWQAMEAYRDLVDDLNVFPVPDADTGTNLVLTLHGGAVAADEAVRGGTAVDATNSGDAAGNSGTSGSGGAAGNDGTASAGDVLAAWARGAAQSARGNSGVILAQLLAGLAGAAADRDALDGGLLASGLRLGAEQAYEAVATPVEGTILSVAAAVAAAAGAQRGRPLAELSPILVEVADAALRRTPTQLPVLAEAGVVDAGGWGVVLLLAALQSVVTGAPVPPPPGYVPGAGTAGDGGTDSSGGSDGADRSDGSAGPDDYEVQFLLDADAAAAARARAQLVALGESVVLARVDERTWSVHVHCADPGAAVEVGLSAGRPSRISVTYLRRRDAPHTGAPPVHGEPHEPREPHSTSPAPTAVPPPTSAEVPTATPAEPDQATGVTVVIAVVHGQGLAELFAGEGVRVLADVGDGEVLRDEIVGAVREAGRVIVLPNAPECVAAATAAAELARAEGIGIIVVPTRSPVQGLAAVAVHDPRRRLDDDAIAMAEAAAATRYAQITVAREQSLTSVGVCHAGDVLGLIDGEVVEIGHGLVAVALALVDRLLGVGAELMTVLLGAGAPTGLADLLRAHVRDRSPLTEVNVYDGGQPDFPVTIGVE